MKRREPVSQIMTHNALTISITQKLNEAKEIMDANGFRHLPVTIGDNLVGIISKTDLDKFSLTDAYENQDAANKAMLATFTVERIMTKSPKTVEQTATIKSVAETFLVNDFHALPVVHDGKLVGIVSSTDVIRYLLEQF